MKRAVAIGLQSVRANLVPMVVLWGLAVGIVIAYNRVSGVAEVLEPLAIWQTRSGCFAAFLNRVAFLGLLPGAFLLCLRTIRPRHVWTVILLQSLWCGLWGVLCDRFFLFQEMLFGAGRDLTTLALKTLVDQLVFTPFLNAPSNALFFFWLSHDLSVARCREARPRSVVGGIVLPNLIANWCVAVPVVFALYALPLALQVQVSGFTGAFWVLACLQIGRRSAKREWNVE